MRCSWCEPLLDAYLENALPPRQMREIGAHVRRCRSCEALLAELRVVDALLTTASPPASVGSEFTAAVVSATAQAHQPPRQRTPLWVFLALYLALGWSFIGILALRGDVFSSMISPVIASSMRALSETGAVLSALSPGTPMLAALVSSVLLIDVILVAALLFFVRRRMRT
jgi:anti-sigma factor RsiW